MVIQSNLNWYELAVTGLFKTSILRKRHVRIEVYWIWKVKFIGKYPFSHHTLFNDSSQINQKDKLTNSAIAGTFSSARYAFVYDSLIKQMRSFTYTVYALTIDFCIRIVITRPLPDYYIHPLVRS